MQQSPQFTVVRSQSDTATTEDTGDGQLFVIEEHLGYVINTVARLFARTLAACIAQYDVTLAQWVILLFLWTSEGMTQTQLSRHVVIDDATMVRTIDRMERDGLVKRVRNPQDRRQHNIFLTDKGRSLRDVLIPCALAVNASALQDLTDAEQDQLLHLLRRIITSLESEPTPPQAAVSNSIGENTCPQ